MTLPPQDRAEDGAIPPGPVLRAPGGSKAEPPSGLPAAPPPAAFRQDAGGASSRAVTREGTAGPGVRPGPAPSSPPEPPPRGSRGARGTAEPASPLAPSRTAPAAAAISGGRGGPPRRVGRGGTTAGPGNPPPGPASTSPPVAEGRAGGAREEGRGGCQGDAAPSPARNPAEGTRSSAVPSAAGQEFRDKWKAALSARAADGRRKRGGKPKPVVPPGSGRLRAAPARPESFGDAPLPPLGIKLPPEPPEAA